jgi:hypothetical protein
MVGAGGIPIATPQIWRKMRSPNYMQLLRITICNALTIALTSSLNRIDEKNVDKSLIQLTLSMLVYIEIALKVKRLALGGSCRSFISSLSENES